jgi:hypothetical protein
MATYVEIYNAIYADPETEKRVVIACVTSADTIIHEDDATANHAERLNWARSVISNPLYAARKMMATVIVNAVIQTGTYTDSDLQWVINQSILAYSGVI